MAQAAGRAEGCWRLGRFGTRADGGDNAWFDYRWWDDPAEAPKFAMMVDSHRKPGYDPLELFWDRAANGVSQNAALVKGSHGVVRERVWPPRSLPTNRPFAH